MPSGVHENMGENPAPPRQRARICKAVNRLGELDRKIFYQRKMRQPSTAPRPAIMPNAIMVQVATNSGEPPGWVRHETTRPNHPQSAPAMHKQGPDAPERPNATRTTAQKAAGTTEPVCTPCMEPHCGHSKAHAFDPVCSQQFKPDYNHEEQWCACEPPQYFFLWYAGKVIRNATMTTLGAKPHQNRIVYRAAMDARAPRLGIHARHGLCFSPLAGWT